MKQTGNIEIAIIGDENQVTLMRFAGVRRYRIIEDDQDVGTKVRDAFQEFSADSSVGIVMLSQNWTGHIADLLDSLRKGSAVIPVVIELPEAYQARKEDVRDYYKTLTKKLIGFSIEL